MSRHKGGTNKSHSEEKLALVKRNLPAEMTTALPHPYQTYDGMR